MEELTRLIREDMKPALGVTEPGAIAFAVASAKKHTSGEVKRVKVALNSGMYKNAFTCGIPGSARFGNLYAAALGAVAANVDKGLQSLEDITREDDEQAARMSAGIELDGKPTLPATVLVLEKQEGRAVLQITVQEGRNHLIRRMCEAVGLEVARLKRISIGPLKLGMLQPGHWRELKPA